jgi:endonuclease/exonuclease/phosphatase family metal-dependent hydrolase
MSRGSITVLTRQKRCPLFALTLVALSLFLGLSSAKEPSSGDSLVFCAYNVRNWLVMDRFENNTVTRNSSKPEAEKAAAIACLKDIAPDILGLSEIGSAADLAEVQDLLKKAGVDLPHSELTGGGDPTRRLGLLSKFPIASRQSVSDLIYQIEGQTFPFQRGILDVSIQPAQDLTFRFIGVHLKSMREVPEADQALMRRNEASLLRKHLDNILTDAPDTPILLYGDFNEHRHESPIKAIQGSRTGTQFMEDIRVVDKRGETWTHYWEAADSYSRLDYLFMSRAMKLHVDTSNSFVYDVPYFDQASDHRPLVTKLRFSATGPR